MKRVLKHMQEVEAHTGNQHARTQESKRVGINGIMNLMSDSLTAGVGDTLAARGGHRLQIGQSHGGLLNGAERNRKRD